MGPMFYISANNG